VAASGCRSRTAGEADEERIVYAAVHQLKAFSSEVDAGSREENTSNKKWPTWRKGSLSFAIGGA